jgi:hypothetical protein
VYALEGPYLHDVEMLAALERFPVKPMQVRRKTKEDLELEAAIVPRVVGSSA